MLNVKTFQNRLFVGEDHICLLIPDIQMSFCERASQSEGIYNGLSSRVQEKHFKAIGSKKSDQYLSNSMTA